MKSLNAHENEWHYEKKEHDESPHAETWGRAYLVVAPYLGNVLPLGVLANAKAYLISLQVKTLFPKAFGD